MTNKIALFILMTLTMSACTTNKKNDKHTDKTAETILLQPLQENETLCYEDDLRRVSGKWIENVHAFVVSVEAKKQGVTEFVVEDTTAFECIVGNALVLSNGTGIVRMLNVFDLNTGNELFPIEDNITDEITPDDNQLGFTFYKYAEDMPIVRWDADMGEWKVENEVPADLYNQDFDRKVEEVQDYLINGMQLAALQKVHVNIKSKKINYLNEYKWSYIE